MSLRSKVAGAATAVVAPEAVAARKLTAGTSRGDVQAELQRRRREAAARSQARKDIRNNPPVQPGDGHDDGDPDTAAPAAQPASASRFSPGPMTAAHTGGGFVLGLMAWALTRAYLTGGADGAKQYLRAKFLNKTGA